MTRIIPWTLPPVKGGSIGGYTPQPTPTPTPEPDPVYLDFDNAEWKTVISGTVPQGWTGEWFGCIKTGITLPTTAVTDQPCTTAYTQVGGIVPVNLVGVSSVKAAIEMTNTVYYLGDGNPKYIQALSTQVPSTATVIVSIDPITYAVTDISGLFSKEAGGYGKSLGSLAMQISKVTYYVYNGNGEIIQQDEVVVE